MSEVEKMRARHKQEIKDLQDNCPHKEWTDWTEWYWAMAHKAHTKRRWCVRCSKLMDETKDEYDAKWDRPARGNPIHPDMKRES